MHFKKYIYLQSKSHLQHYIEGSFESPNATIDDEVDDLSTLPAFNFGTMGGKRNPSGLPCCCGNISAALTCRPSVAEVKALPSASDETSSSRAENT
jgi:hypothetical protein